MLFAGVFLATLGVLSGLMGIKKPSSGKAFVAISSGLISLLLWSYY